MLIAHKLLTGAACLLGVVAASIAPAGFWTGVAIGAILATSGWRVVKAAAATPTPELKAPKPPAFEPVHREPSGAAMTLPPLPPDEPSHQHAADRVPAVTRRAREGAFGLRSVSDASHAETKAAPGSTPFMGQPHTDTDSWPVLAGHPHRDPTPMFAGPPNH